MDTNELKKSWLDVATVGADATQYFYSHLFVHHPEVRDMFPVHMAPQRSRFFAALGAIVSNVDSLAEDSSFVAGLGRDHRRFGVVAEHYPAAAGSLLATLEHFLGDGFTEELRATWTEAFEAVAGIMIAAAAAEEGPAYWDAEVLSVQRRSVDISVLTVRPEQPLPYLPGQSVAVQTPLRPNLWRYYSPANAQRADGTLELHVQVVGGGQVSGALALGTRPGSLVRLGSPIGAEFVVDPDTTGNLLLIAGGTGLAPLRAVAEQLVVAWRHRPRPPRVHLFHGARTGWDCYDHRTLSALAERSWLTYTPVVSHDPAFPGVRGPVGAVAARSWDWPGYTALVCGSTAMIEATRMELARAGLPRHAVRFEHYGDFTVPGGVATSAVDRARQVGV